MKLVALNRTVPILTTIFGALLACAALYSTAMAQVAPSLAAPQAARQLDLVLTWRGYSLVPTAYEGRILSSGGAPVVVKLQAFEDGRPVSLAGYDVEWRSNGIPYSRGENKTEFRFLTETYPPSFYVVSATVREGRAIAGSASVEIPVARQPKVVINAAYPDKKVPRTDAVFQALPYFFSAKNLSDLSFSWSIAGLTIPLENSVSNFASLSFDGAKTNVPVVTLVKNNVVAAEQVTAITHVDVQ